MVFYLNEFSLDGQFSTVEEFVNSELLRIYRCIQLLQKKDNVVIAKISELGDSFVTKGVKLKELRQRRLSDELTQLLHCLDRYIYSDSCWDLNNDIKQDLDGTYIWNANDVTCTSMAEAAENDSPLLSFTRKGLTDLEITIEKKVDDNYKEFYVTSVSTDRYMIDKYGKILDYSNEEIMKVKYHGTRLDFSTIESEYGIDKLEVEEFNNLKNTCEKFIKFEKYEDIFKDDGLRYKAYNPSQDDKDKFKSAKYRRMTIDKFRCSQKLRVYGYRDGDVFRVLRIERDHKMSDHG